MKEVELITKVLNMQGNGWKNKLNKNKRGNQEIKKKKIRVCFVSAPSFIITYLVKYNYGTTHSLSIYRMFNDI